MNCIISQPNGMAFFVAWHDYGNIAKAIMEQDEAIQGIDPDKKCV